MAHMIENGMIAWNKANGQPWHGLGTSVPAGTTSDEMIKLAKLDFTVEAMDIQLSHAPSNALALSKFKAIGRKDTNKVFGVQSDRYKIHQNSDILSIFQEYCDAGHAEMDIVGALRGGAVVWALAKLNGPTTVNLMSKSGKQVDTVTGNLLMVGSHDGTLPTAAYATQRRAVCNNTLFPAMSSGQRLGFKMKHSQAWTPQTAQRAKEEMGITIEAIAEFNQLSAQLANVNVDRKGQIEFISQLNNGAFIATKQDKDNSKVETIDAIDAELRNHAINQLVTNGVSMLDAIIQVDSNTSSLSSTITDDAAKLNRVGKAILDCILNSPGAQLDSANNTLWGCVNGVSYYADHVASRTDDSRLYNAYFGTSVDLKQSAVDAARSLAAL